MLLLLALALLLFAVYTGITLSPFFLFVLVLVVVIVVYEGGPPRRGWW